MRKTANFLDAWCEYAADIVAPPTFHLWAGLTGISGALSRKVWIQTSPAMPPLYPNMYTLLVARPGLGKDTSINAISDLIAEADALAREAGSSIIRLGGESISPKGLIDRLAQEASRQHIKWSVNGQHYTADIHALMLCIGELGTVMPEYDPRLIPMLNDLYNCKSRFQDTIRGAEVDVKNPHLTLLLGNQPQTLAEVIPERNFRMGFTSRIILVFEDHECDVDLYHDNEKKNAAELRKNLIHDLMDIAKMTGPFKVTDQVKELANAFRREKPKEVEGNRFTDYNTRRPLHIHKVAICLSAAESSAKVIELRHWERAQEILFEVEAKMPLIFEQVTSVRGFSETNAELLRLGAGGRQRTMSEVINYMSRTHPPHEVRNILQLARSSGTIVDVTDAEGRLASPPKVLIRDCK